MAQQLSAVATSIVVLLNNITALCVESQNRCMARDTMQALEVYASRYCHGCRSWRYSVA